MNNLYLLNEDTKFQLGCNEVCRFRSSVKTLASALGYSESGIRYWLSLLKDAKVITITRRGGYYDFDVNHNVSFITSNH